MTKPIARAKNYVREHKEAIVVAACCLTGAFIGGMANTVLTEKRLREDYDFIPKNPELD